MIRAEAKGARALSRGTLCFGSCFVGALSSLLGCGESAEIVVGTLGTEVPETGVLIECESAPERGPGDYEWCTEARDGGEATARVTPSEVEATLDSPRRAYAGVTFSFDEDGQMRDLGIWSDLVLVGRLEAGKRFDVYVGDGAGRGCVYYLEGRGTSEYRVPLHQPDFCEPSPCGVVLAATGVSIRASYWLDLEAEVSLTDVHFEGVRPTAPVRAYGSGQGPAGLCWFLLGRESGSAEWQTPLTLELASVVASSPPNAVAGIGVELPEDGSRAEPEYYDLDLDVPAGTPFDVVLSSDERAGGCIYRRIGSGRGTYRIRVAAPDDCFDEGLRNSYVGRLLITTPFDPGGVLEASVFGLAVVHAS